MFGGARHGLVTNYTVDLTVRDLNCVEFQANQVDNNSNTVIYNGCGNTPAAFKIALSPNPGKNNLTINIPQGNGGMSNIRIMDNFGVERKNINTNNLVENINISDLQVGGYNVIVTKGAEIDAKHLQVTP